MTKLEELAQKIENPHLSRIGIEQEIETALKPLLDAVGAVLTRAEISWDTSIDEDGNAIYDVREQLSQWRKKEARQDLAQSSDALKSRNEKQESAAPVARPVSPAQVNASSAQGASEQVPAVILSRLKERHADLLKYKGSLSDDVRILGALIREFDNPAASDGFTSNRVVNNEHAGTATADKSVEYSEPQDSASRSEPRSRKSRRKEMKAYRRRSRRAVLAQMPYREAGEWASDLIKVASIKVGSGSAQHEEWQVFFCNTAMMARPDKATADRIVAEAHRILRRKLRHYAAQEKRALMCKLAFQSRNPEPSAPPSPAREQEKAE